MSAQPPSLAELCAAAGERKTRLPITRLFAAGMLAGMLIAFGAAASSTAIYALGNASAARLAAGALFPFGLAMVLLSGAELFTGNCLILVAVLAGRVRPQGMLRNWAAVYAGNFAGSVLLAACCAFSGQMDLSGGKLAVWVVRTAAAKCALPPDDAFLLGALCNVLVCLGVACSLGAGDTTGKVIGAYLPVAVFVVCGFEHCVANMFYIPAGLFALRVPHYAQLCAAAGINTSPLTWTNFAVRNLLPVTAGNVAGGLALAAGLWTLRSAPKESARASIDEGECDEGE